MNQHIPVTINKRINNFSKDAEHIMEESNNEAALLNAFVVLSTVGLSYSLYHEVAYGDVLVELESVLALGALTYLLSLSYYQRE